MRGGEREIEIKKVKVTPRSVSFYITKQPQMTTKWSVFKFVWLPYLRKYIRTERQSFIHSSDNEAD